MYEYMLQCSPCIFPTLWLAHIFTLHAHNCYFTGLTQTNKKSDIQLSVLLGQDHVLRAEEGLP